MRTLLTLIFITAATYVASSQPIEQRLQSFNKIVVSHKIDLVLIPGDTESIRIDYSGVDPGDIIIDQSHHRVHVYLQHAKFFDIGERKDDMFDRRERYRHAKLTAYVTFKSLKLVEIRGEGEVICEAKIYSKKLKLRAFGEIDMRLAYLDAARLKARLYGENTLKILDGEAGHLSYKMYGENKIDSRGLTSVTSNTTIYGEGLVRIHASDEVRLNSFGEPSLIVSGSPYISKGIILGHVNIKRN